MAINIRGMPGGYLGNLMTNVMGRLPTRPGAIGRPMVGPPNVPTPRLPTRTGGRFLRGGRNSNRY
jgi:hypothetical protein